MTLTFEQVYETLPGNGWLSKEEARLLWDVVNRVNGDILEVGCYQGRSTVLLAATGRQVIVVDPFEGFEESDPSGDRTCGVFGYNISSRKIANVLLHRYKIEMFAAQPVGFAYLDGDHSYEGTKAQILAAKDCGAGIIAIHDVNDSGGGCEVRRAALELLGPWNERVERLAVWVTR